MFSRKNQNYDWSSIRESLSESGSIHLWLAHIPSFDLGKIFDLLSEEEINKGEKFYFAKDRKTYLVGRGLLRFLLGRYANISARNIRFDYNPFGKPQVAFSPSEEILFNISHSGEFCLTAISRSNQIGVDIELIKPVEYELLAKNIFSVAEQAEFDLIPDVLKSKSFFCGWTRKESFIKGIGEGLSFPLKKFSVALNPEILVSKVGIHSENSENYEGWKTYDISFEPQYRAALAVKNPKTISFEKFYANDYFQLL